MEELLNKLIEKGWKPFKVPCKYFEKCNGLEGIPFYHFISNNVLFHGGTRKYSRPSLRQIVSKESGLWQFVCENGMINIEGGPNYYWLEDLFNCGWLAPDYWLMESSLIDEDKLEKFLLENIKIS